MTEPLTVEHLQRAAADFAREFSESSIDVLYGVDNGKTIGTHVEVAFNDYVIARFDYSPGNAASGIDFPELGVDLKVTSSRQPQSSCPFRDATQKVYGLGYHLLVMVYEKADDHESRSARLQLQHVVFIDQVHTADFQTTSGIHRILSQDGNVDDIDAWLQERNLPLDEIGRRDLAERIFAEPPALGYLTISNALQWRLQYGRAIAAATDPSIIGLDDLIA